MTAEISISTMYRKKIYHVHVPLDQQDSTFAKLYRLFKNDLDVLVQSAHRRFHTPLILNVKDEIESVCGYKTSGTTRGEHFEWVAQATSKLRPYRLVHLTPVGLSFNSKKEVCILFVSPTDPRGKYIPDSVKIIHLVNREIADRFLNPPDDEDPSTKPTIELLEYFTPLAYVAPYFQSF